MQRRVFLYHKLEYQRIFPYLKVYRRVCVCCVDAVVFESVHRCDRLKVRITISAADRGVKKVLSVTGLFAPAGTPEPVMKTLRDAMRQVVNDPEFKAAMAKIETPIVYMDAPAFQKYFDQDAKRLTSVVRQIGKIE